MTEIESTSLLPQPQPVTLDIPSAPVPKRQAIWLVVLRWVAVIPAGVLSIFVFQSVFRYLIAHAPDEMYSLPGGQSVASVLVCLFAGAVGAGAAAYVAPSHQGTVATVFAAVVSALLVIASVLEWSRLDWQSVLEVSASIAGMVASAVKVNWSESDVRCDAHFSRRSAIPSRTETSGQAPHL